MQLSSSEERTPINLEIKDIIINNPWVLKQ